VTSGTDLVEMADPKIGDSLAWLRERVTTTPGRLRLVAVVLALALIVFGVVAATAARERRQATDAVTTKTEPLLVQADLLYSSLSDADATAATTFLTGGIEPVALRQRYLADLRTATAQLTALTQEVGGASDAHAAISTIATQLTLYAGLVDTARANNRQGLPVGAAYLREASTSVMRGQILPAARQLYEIESRRLASDYGSASSGSAIVLVVGIGLVVLALLVFAQVYVLRLSNRILNVPMVVASLLVVAAGVWLLAGFGVEQSALSSARARGSDSVEVLSATRILLLRAERDERLALIARGGDAQPAADFAAVTAALGPTNGTSGLLADASRLARVSDSAAAFDDLAATLGRYEAAHSRVAALESAGRFMDAARLAVGPKAPETILAARLSRDLEQEISAAQGRFQSHASDANVALRGLWLGVPVLVALMVLLTVFGLGQRIREYR
jgi:hypothetical protein